MRAFVCMTFPRNACGLPWKHSPIKGWRGPAQHACSSLVSLQWGFARQVQCLVRLVLQQWAPPHDATFFAWISRDTLAS